VGGSRDVSVAVEAAAVVVVLLSDMDDWQRLDNEPVNNGFHLHDDDDDEKRDDDDKCLEQL
jgi:hypothetical protein